MSHPITQEETVVEPVKLCNKIIKSVVEDFNQRLKHIIKYVDDNGEQVNMKKLMLCFNENNLIKKVVLFSQLCEMMKESRSTIPSPDIWSVLGGFRTWINDIKCEDGVGELLNDIIR